MSGFAVVFGRPMRASAEKNGGKAAEKRQADFKLSTEMSIVAEIAAVVKKKNCFIYKNQCYIICMELKEANTIDTVVFDQVTVRV